ncbi:MAG: NAD(P)-dependent oxidoreductase, partial [Clostridiales bacterium]|nr:NAD(P)-dependent oxidoreductase [Clostridiales bacterium]
MNILLTGLITPMISAMIPRLQRNAHHVTISAAGLYEVDENKAPNKTKRITKEVQKILQGKRYQALIFFYAYQCEETMDDVSVQGTMLDDLFEYQQAAAQHGVKHFILITDQRVFGSVQDLAESQAPAPDTSAGILIKAAEDYLLSSGADGVEKLIIRVTNLYMPGQQDAFFSRALICAQNNEPMLIEATEETPCDFLHADDLAQCICLAIESDISGIVNLAYEDQSTYKSAINLVLKHLPGLTVTYSGKSERYESLKTSQAVKRLDWVPRHHWMQELGEILAVDDEKLQKRNPLHVLTNQGSRLLNKMIPWIELVLFGGLAFWLTSISKVYANFRIADYWLFYPILMGSLHGGPIGIAAGLIACAFFGLDWVREGNDLYRLLYNIDNWLPLMMYMLAGGLFGYMHDKTNERMKMLEEEMREHDAKTKFMENMYKQASEDSVLLQKQVLNNRDSFGRIFNITMELESMQPEQVYLSTLNVLEDTMQNHSVAIYSRSGYTSYARLAASSPKYGGKLSKSLDVAQFPL